MKWSFYITTWVLLTLILTTHQAVLFAQEKTGNTEVVINPTNWWIGMEHNEVQLIIRSNNPQLAKQSVTVNHPGVTIMKIIRPENTSYLIVDVLIQPDTRPGKVQFLIGKDTFHWTLKRKDESNNGKTYAQGVTSKDLIYLIMPDRFCNGDPANDRVPGMRDQSLRRDTVFNRHGGDLVGIQSKLDYLASLGVTAIWLNPVLTNDMDDRTEHGYAITDHYEVDPRHGGNQAYKDLIKAAHSKGIKVIKDAIYNHVGIYHWSVVDPPMEDWLHHWPSYQQTSYKDQVLMDPYASESDRQIMSDGWFVPLMPDLNQHNEVVARFLIQHALWCVEEFGIDGWRIDTYAYNDLEFMNRCNEALIKEYPNISIFGETWVHGVINQSFFTKNNYNINYKSNQPGVTDFQLLWGINDVMNKPFGWTDGVNKLYTTLAQDFVYDDPYTNVIFLDNHDLSRAWSVYGENMAKYKMAMSWLLTCRGIPQLYYGNEILMAGVTSPNDGYVRKDFMGGWQEDPVNKFTVEGRSKEENEIWDHISTLAKYRKNSPALTTGKMMQFVPVDGLYVFFRYEGEETIMCVMNTVDKDAVMKIDRFAERTNGYNTAVNLLTKEKLLLEGSWSIPPWTMYVLKLEK